MRDNNNEMLPRVDNKGNVIGKVSRGEAHNGSGILHPVVHLHVFDSQGRIYLQLRPKWKTIQPGKWDTACGGHVAYGEDVETALKREVEEELGISNFKPEPLGEYIFKSAIDSEYVHVFKTIYDGPVNPSKMELDGGAFFSKKQMEDAISEGLMTPNFVQEYGMFFR